MIIKAIADQANLAKQQAEQGQQQAEMIALQERHQKERLEAYLRSIGVDPNEI
jgi:hypothetical protein